MLNLGIALQEQREKAELTQNQLALKTGIKQQNISRWESNMNVPNVVDCIKLADFYGCTLDYLLGREDDVGNISVLGTELNAHEQKLIDCYRNLTEDGKTAFLSMAENIATIYRSAATSKIS